MNNPEAGEHASPWANALAPPGRRFWVMPEMTVRKKVPTFSIKYAASVFFGRSPSWIRDMETPELPQYPEGRFLLDGQRMGFERDTRGARLYRLHDIEPMAHSVYRFGVINLSRLHACVEVVKWVGRLHGILEDRMKIINCNDEGGYSCLLCACGLSCDECPDCNIELGMELDFR